MTRRFALILVALASTTSLVLAACSSAPAAPALTDPNDILAQTVVSLKDVKTVEITGSLTGTLEAAELGGSLDLSTTKISAAIDVAAEKAKFSIDAPSIMGTKIDAVLLDGAAYYKIDGLLSSMAGGTPGKYTKQDVPKGTSGEVTDPAEIAKAVDEIKEGLDKLPTPPTKAADEKCGDQDCYHVTITATADQLQGLDPTGGAASGDVKFDLWTRHSDRLPAKLSVSVDSPEVGTVGMTFDFRYGVNVSVDAPPADQIAP